MRHWHLVTRALPPSWRRLITAGALGVSIGWATSPFIHIESPSIPLQKSLQVEQGIVVHRAAAFGLPSFMGMSIQKDYIAAFDWRTRNPIWVAQMLRKSVQPRTDTPDRSKVQFSADSSVPAPFRTHHRDFSGSGLDRGHLAPSSDAESQQGLEETFLMTNISPQVGDGFNRTYWNRIERFVRRLVEQYEEVYVVSGPLFLPDSSNSKIVKYDVIGNRIAVPTHFFKSVLAVRSGKISGTSYWTVSFIVPNRSIDPSSMLSSFKVPLEDLESKAGLILWPNLKRSALSDLCDATECSLALLPKFNRRRSISDCK